MYIYIYTYIYIVIPIQFEPASVLANPTVPRWLVSQMHGAKLPRPF